MSLKMRVTSTVLYNIKNKSPEKADYSQRAAKSLKAALHSFCESKSKYQKQPWRDASPFEERRGIFVLNAS